MITGIRHLVWGRAEEEIEAEMLKKCDPEKLKQAERLFGSKEKNFEDADESLNGKARYQILKNCPNEFALVFRQWETAEGYVHDEPELHFGKRRPLNRLEKFTIDEFKFYETHPYLPYATTAFSVAGLAYLFFFLNVTESKNLELFCSLIATVALTLIIILNKKLIYAFLKIFNSANKEQTHGTNTSSIHSSIS